MLQRLTTNFVFIFLFAFVQIGAATHEISHAADITKQSQQDKNTHGEQCPQCISFAKVAGGIASQPFVLPVICASFINTVSNYFHHSSYLHIAYAARAPPQIIRI